MAEGKLYMTAWFENGELLYVRTYRNQGAANCMHTLWVKQAKFHNLSTHYIVSIAIDIGISPEMGIVSTSRVMRDWSYTP